MKEQNQVITEVKETKKNSSDFITDMDVENYWDNLPDIVIEEVDENSLGMSDEAFNQNFEEIESGDSIPDFDPSVINESIDEESVEVFTEVEDSNDPSQKDPEVVDHVSTDVENAVEEVEQINASEPVLSNQEFYNSLTDEPLKYIFKINVDNDSAENKQNGVLVDLNVPVSEILDILVNSLYIPEYPGKDLDEKETRDDYKNCHCLKHLYNNLNTFVSDNDEIIYEELYNRHKSELEEEAKKKTLTESTEDQPIEDSKVAESESVEVTETDDKYPPAEKSTSDLFYDLMEGPDLPDYIEVDFDDVEVDLGDWDYSDTQYIDVSLEFLGDDIWDLIYDNLENKEKGKRFRLNPEKVAKLGIKYYPGKEQDDKETRDDYKFYYLLQYLFDNLERLASTNATINSWIYDKYRDEVDEKAAEEAPTEYERWYDAQDDYDDDDRFL